MALSMQFEIITEFNNSIVWEDYNEKEPERFYPDRTSDRGRYHRNSCGHRYPTVLGISSEGVQLFSSGRFEKHEDRARSFLRGHSIIPQINDNFLKGAAS